VRLPWWAQALDVLTLVLGAAILRVALTSPIRLKLGAADLLVMKSWPRLLLWAVICVALRHVLHRARPLHIRLRDWSRRLARQPAVQAVWPSFVVSRLMVILAGYFAVLSIGFDQTWTPWRISKIELFNLPARFDAGYYLAILEAGYHWDGNPAHYSTIAFFPGFPILIRAVAILLGSRDALAGFVVVSVAFFLALVYLYRLASEYLEPDQAQAAVMLAAFYPFGVYYSAIYTESVFLLAALGAVYHFRHNQLLRAALFGLLAGLTRPNGFLLSALLGLLALAPLWEAWRRRLPSEPAAPAISWSRFAMQVAAAAAPVVGVLLYTEYIYSLTGDPLMWLKVQQAWGRSADYLGSLLDSRIVQYQRLGLLAYLEANPAEVLDAAGGLLAIIAIGPIVRRFNPAYGLFVALCVIPSFTSIATASLGRYTAPLFPIYLWLAGSIPAGRRTYWIAAFASVQALVAALFFTWRPPY